MYVWSRQKLGYEAGTIQRALQVYVSHIFRAFNNWVDEWPLVPFISEKNGRIESGQLPPCEDVLFHHAQRANYQAGIWRRCLINSPTLPDPESCGWFIENNVLHVKWMSGLPAPEAVLEFIACKSRKECTMSSCQCMTNQLKCTAACTLQSCRNMMSEVEECHINEMYETDSDWGIIFQVSIKHIFC